MDGNVLKILSLFANDVSQRIIFLAYHSIMFAFVWGKKNYDTNPQKLRLRVIIFHNIVESAAYSFIFKLYIEKKKKKQDYYMTNVIQMAKNKIKLPVKNFSRNYYSHLLKTIRTTKERSDYMI